ncbi:MAG: hypothetical protein PUC36_05275 [Clostridiales bacterium]|nr:hypothetical protein [Clostridiales bacterium]
MREDEPDRGSLLAGNQNMAGKNSAPSVSMNETPVEMGKILPGGPAGDRPFSVFISGTLGKTRN